MNWYKTEYLNATSAKYAISWSSAGKGFLVPLIIGGGLLTLVMQSGVSNEELTEIAERNNRNVPAIRQELENKVKSMGHSIAINQPQAIQTPQIKPKSNNFKETILNELIGFEGTKEKVYNDPLLGDKARTIGIGFNLSDPAISNVVKSLGYDVEALKSRRKILNQKDQIIIANELINIATQNAKRDIPNFDQLNDEAKSILIQMEYQMGSLIGWNKLKNALMQAPPNYQEAAKEMLDSKWARQLRNLLDNPSNYNIQTRAEKLE